jgi:hypothetical protein
MKFSLSIASTLLAVTSAAVTYDPDWTTPCTTDCDSCPVVDLETFDLTQIIPLLTPCVTACLPEAEIDVSVLMATESLPACANSQVLVDCAFRDCPADELPAANKCLANILADVACPLKPCTIEGQDFYPTSVECCTAVALTYKNETKTPLGTTFNADICNENCYAEVAASLELADFMAGGVSQAADFTAECIRAYSEAPSTSPSMSPTVTASAAPSMSPSISSAPSIYSSEAPTFENEDVLLAGSASRGQITGVASVVAVVATLGYFF